MTTATHSTVPRPELMTIATDDGPADGAKSDLVGVFEAEESGLLRFACGMLRQREAAEDIVQEAFLKLHDRWGSVANPRAWLYRAVRNLALNHLRDHRRETVTDTPPELGTGEAAGDEAARMEAAGAIRMLIAELPDDEARLLRLKYHEGLKYEEISRETGLSVGNVGYKLHHLLKRLADGLRELGIESAEG